jgi:signal transduction histidine kinase
MAFDPAAAEPRRVLLLHSFGRDFAPFSDFAAHFRELLVKQSQEPIDLYEASVETARFKASTEDNALVDYLRALFAARRLDLIVTLGGPAAKFVQQNRLQLFTSTPVLMSALDQRRIDVTELTAQDSVVAVTIDLPALVENILRLQPDTANIAVAIGASPLEKYWVEAMPGEFQQSAKRVNFIWWNELSLDQMRTRAAALPARSAILYFIITVDAEGVPYEQDRALDDLHAVANAPIFGFAAGAFGRGIVGGPLLSNEELAHRAVGVALRIFNGETPGDIKTEPLGLGKFMYDWRELQRWGISEARLPPSSVMYFRGLTVWERFRWEIIWVISVIVLQYGIIHWLLFERHRRRYAELESRSRQREVIHMDRATVAGALSASFAHELNQPLGAILSNAEAAEMLLDANPPDLNQVKEILGEIRQADQHAANIVGDFRKLLKQKSEIELQEFDLNDAIAGAMRLLSPEARKRGIVVHPNGVHAALPVRADQIQVQQVLLNLATNGMDAMSSCAPGARQLAIETALNDNSEVEVSVSDTGGGIPNDKLKDIFKTFYTTKQQGTGLGLSIARTIVESYGGKIWAENRIGRGAVFRFTLPLAKPQAA